MVEYPGATYHIDGEVVEIVSTPETLDGAPCVDDRRITVSTVRELWRDGHSVDELAGEESYPPLSEAQVRAALHYAVDHPDAVERAPASGGAPLALATRFDDAAGAAVLAAFDGSEAGPGDALAEAALRVGDLPDGYSVEDLHAAWRRMRERDAASGDEAGERPS